MTIFSVSTRSITAEPGTAPAVGSRYLVPTAATGADWSGKDGRVAIYAASGWLFAAIPIGQPLYVEDEDKFYYKNASGVWGTMP